MANEHLSAFLDGELTEAEHAELELELERNALLRAELDQIVEVRETLKLHGGLVAPSGFAERILASVADEPLPANQARWWRRPFGMPLEGVAVAAAALLIVVAGLRREGAGTSDTEPANVAETTPAAAAAAAAASPPVQQPTPDAPKEVAAAGSGAENTPAPRQAPEKTAKDSGALRLSTRGGTAPVADGVEGTASSYTTSSSPTLWPEAKKEETQITAGEQAQAQAPAVESLATWKYRIVTTDPTILADLERLAGKFGGHLLDARKRPLKDTVLQSVDGGSYLIDLPSASMVRFDAAIRAFGADAPAVKQDIYATDRILVEISIGLVDPPKKSAPSSSAQ